MDGRDEQEQKRKEYQEQQAGKSSLAPINYRAGDYQSYLDSRPADLNPPKPATPAKAASTIDFEAYRKQFETQQQAPVQTEQPVRAGPTGFVGFSQQLAANQDVAARMAGDAGRAAMEGGGVGNLRNDAGRQALLQRAYGKAAQVTGFDAALAGGAGGDYFGQLQSAYGPEAMARTAASMAAGRRDAAATQQRFNQEGAATQQARSRAERVAKEQRVQEEVAQLQRQSELPGTGAKTRNVTPEAHAAKHGMTLEEWVRNGKNPPY